MTHKTKVETVDFAERVTATFVQAFLAVALVTGVSDVTSLKVAGAAGALAVGKFVYAKAQAFTAPRRGTNAQPPREG